MKIIIAGGVALGAASATKLRRNNPKAQITVYEKSSHISYANCGLPYGISGLAPMDRLQIVTPELLRKQRNINANVNHEVIGIDTSRKVVKVKDLITGREFEDNYDKLILGTGTSPLQIPIKGIENEPNVFSLKTYDDLITINNHISKSGPKRAVIIGGGFIGVEVAENLIHSGLFVTMIEMQDRILRLDRGTSSLVENELWENNVKVYTKTTINQVNAKDKTLELSNGKVIKYDFLFTTGTKPNTSFIKESGIKVDQHGLVETNDFLQTSDPDVYAGGDIIKVPSYLSDKKVYSPFAWHAKTQAKIIANNIAFGNKETVKPTTLASILKVFKLSVGKVGLGYDEAIAAGFKARQTMITSKNHAAYYPGSDQLILKLIWDGKTKKVLGLHALGASADKKVDVIATAITSGMTIDDLEYLNLSYAPPFSSTQDPINVVAAVARKEFKNSIESILGIDVENEFLIDTRPANQHAEWHVEHAINVPRDQILKSERISKLDKNKKIFVHCNTGFGSSLSAYILVNMGFKNVKNVMGGNILYQIMKLNEKRQHN